MKVLFFKLLTELSSRKSISWITGTFAKSALSKKLIPQFAKTFGISIEDAEKPLSQYASLNEFFTRRLKPGLRPIHTDPTQVISPVDGVISGKGVIDNGTLLGIKGQNYSISQLLHKSHRTEHFLQGSYLVIYLSPKDYHRIHAPVTGVIREKEHISGCVYPVHEFGLTHMRKVLSRNERLVTYIGTPAGEVALVKVGAMNVSSIQYVANLHASLERGEELAYFEFGSTVVLLFQEGLCTYRTDLAVGTAVQMGEAIGTLHQR